MFNIFIPRSTLFIDPWINYIFICSPNKGPEDTDESADKLSVKKKPNLHLSEIFGILTFFEEIPCLRQ